MKVDQASVERAFVELYRPFFERHGFSSTQWDLFERVSGDVRHRVSIGPRKKTSGIFSITGGGYGICVPEIERLRVQDAVQATETVGMPLHLIHPERRFREWEVTSSNDIAATASEIQDLIVRYGFPYLERFSSSDDVIAALASPTWDKWFSCGQDYRDATLVYASLAQGRRGEGLTLGRTLLEKYDGRSLKYSLSLREAIACAERKEGNPPRN